LQNKSVGIVVMSADLDENQSSGIFKSVKSLDQYSCFIAGKIIW